MTPNEETRQEALQRLLRPLEDGRMELVVTYRRHEDYEVYEQQLYEMREQIRQLQRDIATWTVMGNQYLSTLDELRRLQKILRKHNITF